MNQNLFELLSPVLQTFLVGVVSVLTPVLMGYAVLWLNQQIAKGKASLSASQLDFVNHLIYGLVLAAEQSGIAGIIENEGRAKKEMVIRLAEQELAKRKINIDLDVLVALVESNVFKAFKQVDFPKPEAK